MQAPTCGPPTASGSRRLLLIGTSMMPTSMNVGSTSSMSPSRRAMARQSSTHSSVIPESLSGLIPSRLRQAGSASLVSSSHLHSRGRRGRDRYRRNRYRRDHHWLRRPAQIPRDWGRASSGPENSGRRGSGRDHTRPCSCSLSHSTAGCRPGREIRPHGRRRERGRLALPGFVRRRT
jgi:hypothetical protein